MPTQKFPLLTPAEAFGPEIERFRSESQALTSWRDKQSQRWLFWGALHTMRGRTYGFQLSFFDHRTQNDFLGAIPARWITQRSFSAQFALTDRLNADASRAFRSWQQGGFFSKKTGFASEGRFHVEMSGWHAYRNEKGSITVFANGDNESLHLELQESKPMSFHGQKGYIDHNYVCSYPRMKAKGLLVIDGALEEVQGLAWFDHEKKTPLRDEGAAELSRIALQFNSGQELILFLHDETVVGSWIEDTGESKHLIATEVEIENIEYAKSPQTGARYPLRRRIRIDHLKLELIVKPSVEMQEIDATKSLFTATWRGLIEAYGQLDSAEISATGFMELLGYDERPRAQVFRFLMTP
ncbi:MAG: lipocalin-like domain-containing protein [Bdellovibrionota bacterium]